MSTNFQAARPPVRWRRPHPVTVVAAALLVLGIAAAVVGIVNRVAPSGSGAGGSNVATDAASALVDVNVTTDSSAGAGTGIVLTSSGEVLTNNHVIRGARTVSVTDIGNGRTYTGDVVGYAPGDDVAVIQLRDASGLQTARIGSDGASVGDRVTAIGNAGGTGGAPSRAPGSITALGRSIEASDEISGTSEQLTGLIQVDANLQPGDSGGALVDASGRVIGMNAAASLGFSFASNGSEGYAIPIAHALSLVKQIESGNGTPTVHVGSTAFLGIQVGSNDDRSSSGAAVLGIVDGAPAQGAGIAEGDTITSLDDRSVDSATTLGRLLVPHHPGDSIHVGWVDAYGQSHTATVKLATGAPA